MALVINSNIASMQAQKNLSNTQQQQSVTFQRLSTGLRINSAKDDAGGLFLAEAQTKDIRGLNMATRNAGDGISMAQTAEGALDQIGKNLQRVNELAIQSANGSYNDAARGGLQKEVDELTQEINRIVETTEFNGQKLLSKDATQTDLQIGFKNDAGSIIKTGLEGGLVAQGSAAKFTFEGASQTYFNKDQANAAGQLELSKNFLKGSTDPADTFSASYAGVAISALSATTASDTSKEIAEGMKQLGNGESFTVDGMTFSRQQQAHGDTAGQQLKIEFNGNETTVDGAWSADGVYTPTTTISTDNMADLFGKPTAASPNAPLAQNYFTDASTTITPKENTFKVSDLKAFDEGLLSALKNGESAELDGVTFTRNDQALAMNSVNGSSSVVSIAGVFKADGDTGFADADKPFANGDFASLFGDSAKEVGIMADLLTGDLSATKVIDISSQASAREAIDFTRDSIDLISELRATFGAVQNRFEAVIAGNDTYSENLSAARSRVQDADFAAETANLAKQQVLQQAGVSILGQANATGQSVLGLL